MDEISLVIIVRKMREYEAIVADAKNLLSHEPSGYNIKAKIRTKRKSRITKIVSEIVDNIIYEKLEEVEKVGRQENEKRTD